MADIIIPLLTGLSGLFFGALIGYYKSRSEFMEKMNQKVSKVDCATCDLRKTVGDIEKDLESGGVCFNRIAESIGQMQTDIALIKQTLETQKKVS